HSRGITLRLWQLINARWLFYAFWALAAFRDDPPPLSCLVVGSLSGIFAVVAIVTVVIRVPGSGNATQDRADGPRAHANQSLAGDAHLIDTRHVAHGANQRRIGLRCKHQRFAGRQNG